MEILYRDRDLVLCIKPFGADSEKDMSVMLCEALKVLQVFCVHRLDRDAGGVMVYALSQKAAGALSAAMSEHTKEYLLLVSGVPDPAEGEMHDLLFHDARRNKTYVTDRMRGGVKKALLNYHTIGTASFEDQPVSLVSVRLVTGRTHQIRVQFASRKMPLLGDRKYGSTVKMPNIALWSHRLTMVHPFTHKEITGEAQPPEDMPWNLFSQETR